MKKSQRALLVAALACGALATYAWQEPTVLHNLYASATGAARGGTPAGGA
ncbi:ferric-dicitrate binding protein FerR (iron transport regulator), partial [Oxalobacteraceae bacterium GrIS 1.11]